MLFRTSNESQSQVLTQETKDNTGLFVIETPFQSKDNDSTVWPGSELPHITRKLEVFLYMYPLISML